MAWHDINGNVTSLGVHLLHFALDQRSTAPTVEVALITSMPATSTLPSH